MFFYTVRPLYFQIVGVRPSDEGVYTCVADNGRGTRPTEATVTLAVDRPTRIPAAIVETEPRVYLSLGNQPAVLHCLAYGYPEPQVTW